MAPELRKWLLRKPRSRAETVSRWGHIFQEAEDAGEVMIVERRVVMRGRFRDITDTVVLSDRPGSKQALCRNPGHEGEPDMTPEPKKNLTLIPAITIYNFQVAHPGPYTEERAQLAPYGLWVDDFGDEVLFNRRYEAIYWRSVEDRMVQPTSIRPSSATKAGYFRDDGHFNPHSHPYFYPRCLYILGCFVAFEPMEPFLLRDWEHSIPHSPKPE